MVHTKLVEVKMQLDKFEETVDFLCFFKDFWISFCMQMQAFRDVFLVLERTYLLRTKGTTFWQLGLQSVKTQMTISVRQRLIEGVIQLI